MITTTELTNNAHQRVTQAKERPNRAAYYRTRYANPILRLKKLEQIKAYKQRRKVVEVLHK